MAEITITYGDQIRRLSAPAGILLGDVIARSELPMEQPCAGRGVCGKCKLLAEKGLLPPDDVERQNLTEGERAVGNRLACRARIAGDVDVEVTLSPVVVYSNKVFHTSNRYKRDRHVPLGLAIDLGSTTVAALLTMMDNGEVCAAAASLNQQSVYGADIISRLAAATDDAQHAHRLQRLTLASINQAIDALNLAPAIRARISRVIIVGNVAMHHLLTRLPLDTLVELPFQPHDRAAIRDASPHTAAIFAPHTTVSLPPLIGGFVGSDALACLAYFGFHRAAAPMAAIDLGTNGEVMVTDGNRILTASTAAGPAFEGVNISCGVRAVDGAIVATRLDDSGLQFDTIADEPPTGLTGSGLISLVHQLRCADVIDASGRIADHPLFAGRTTLDAHGARILTLNGEGALTLSQWDVRELQKAKGAIRAAVDVLLDQLGLVPGDLQRLILTGSFGGQIDIDAVLALGMIPPVQRAAVETVANGAGFGATLFLTDEGFALVETLAARAEQIDLDLDPDFIMRYVQSMSLTPSP